MHLHPPLITHSTDAEITVLRRAAQPATDQEFAAATR